MFSRSPLQDLANKVQAILDTHHKRISQLEQRARNMENNQQSAGRAPHWLDEVKDKTETYAQIITLIGYGGFFALWTQTTGRMPLLWFAATGLLITISLLTFIGFELYKAYKAGKFFSRPDYISTSVDEYRAEVDAMNKHWFWTFSLACVTGLAGGFSLLAWFLYATIVGAAQTLS